MPGTLATHGVIPAQAGIHVRGQPQTSSVWQSHRMDSGLRRNDTVNVKATAP